MEYIQFHERADDEGVQTKTSEAETNNENMTSAVLIEKEIMLSRKHLNYAARFFNVGGMARATKTYSDVWFGFYSLFPLIILKYPDEQKVEQFKQLCLNYFKEHKTVYGAFSGNVYDHPSLVSNLSVLYATPLIDSEEAYNLWDQAEIYNVLMKLKTKDGSFRTSFDGEADIRATYCAVLHAHTLNILTPELLDGVLEFTLSCYNYDGGFGPLPHCESHGGYIHCGIGILHILGKLDQIDLNKTIRWLTNRQMPFHGGFNGRVNKLVDTCYTWWEGCSMKIISDYLGIGPFWNQEATTKYTLMAAQDIFGGFADHVPSKSDPYHTCFSLAGISVIGTPEKFGMPEIDPLICAPKDAVERFRRYFSGKHFCPEK